MKRHWMFVGVAALFCAVLLGVYRAEAQVSQTRRFVITDLPPSVARSSAPKLETDIFVDAAPIGITILRVCQQYGASCAVTGNSFNQLGYTCNGAAAVCWRQFISSLTAAGIAVLVAPAVGGASYSFNLGGAGAPAAPAASSGSSPPPQ